jgi:signal transduction histidine kinase
MKKDGPGKKTLERQTASASRTERGIVARASSAAAEKAAPAKTARSRGHSREMLNRATYDLRERVKELNCLYSISRIVERQGISMEEFLRETVNLVPPAWQYPEITCSRIIVKDRELRTSNFRETSWQQSQSIIVHGKPVGTLQVCYLEERPEKDEGPFLEEERSLIKVIAERIGGIIQRQEAEAALRESEAHNRALLNAIPDLMFQIDKEGKLLGFHEGKLRESRPFFESLVGKNAFDVAREKRLLPKRILEQGMTYVKRAFVTGKIQVFEQHVNHEAISGDFEVRVVAGGEDEVLGIVRDITQRKRLEREILEISGREQRRIGQDLHDSLCQHLAGIGFMTKVLERKLASGLSVDSAEASELVSLIDQAITLTRGFARGLNPVRLDEGLRAALEELAANCGRLFGIRCSFESDEPIAVIDETTATHVYRIAQEALNNAVKHARANSIAISFQTDGQACVLNVRDDGIGFPAPSNQGKGMGLNIMRYRASMIGGVLDIRNAEHGGTVLVCSFPQAKMND